ncbi:DNA mismatch endonuclease Vsr [Stenotrophomonas maltophilia]|uniref:Very short patch repair endonuclease n=2 Tax=Stenotrophomonas maltophilia TaxID=40324 RepID=A0ABD7C5N2_STEMA|nr:DNA mismatch endonuclease Vsr [Stenotrophomonas maltophilia]
MADTVSQEVRSRMMSRIRNKNSKPELLVRKYLHRHGFRYRIHDLRIAGRPDVVLPKYRCVIFVHGCFWHRHRSCKYAATPATRPEFWIEKLEKNRMRDERVQSSLLQAGWRVAIVWECSLKASADATLAELQRFVLSDDKFTELA